MFIRAGFLSLPSVVEEVFDDEGEGKEGIGNFKLLTGPIRFSVTAYLPMPKTISKKRRAAAMPVVRPDLDNYVKQVEDALLGYAYRDDAQIVTIIARKRYGEPPRWEITLDEIEDVTG